MFDSLEVEVLFPSWWRRRDSEPQRRRCEAWSERSVEQRREPMNKNQIRGIRCRTSGRLIAKSISIKGAGCRSGGLRVEGGQTYLGRSAACPGIGTEGGAIHSERAAEVSSGHSSCASSEGPNGRKRQVGGATR